MARRYNLLFVALVAGVLSIPVPARPEEGRPPEDYSITRVRAAVTVAGGHFELTRLPGTGAPSCCPVSGPLTVGVSDAVGREGDGGSTPLVFMVTRSHNNSAFTVRARTTGGTATAGVDYKQVDTVVGFQAGGALSRTVEVPMVGDTRPEPDETVVLTLSNLTAGSLSDAVGVGTIDDDDDDPPIFADGFESGDVSAWSP